MMKIKLNKQTAIFAIGIVILFCRCSMKAPDQKLEPAGLNHIRTEGELKIRLHKNFDRLEEAQFQPQNLFWSEKESNGWPADKEGRTILGLVMDARATNRSPKYLEKIICMLPDHLNPKGYMGTIHSGLINEQQLSGHGWLLRGLNEYYEWSGDNKVLGISKMIVDSLFIPITPNVKDYPLTEESRIIGAGAMSGTIQNCVGRWALSSDIGCVFIAMDGVIHAYKNNPDSMTKSLIDELVKLFLQVDLISIKAQTHASLTGMRGLIRYAEITGDTTLVHEVEKRWKLYKEYGMTENYENYNWFRRYETWTEPCAIVDSYMVAVQLWKNTRNPKYLEDAERIYWNALSVTQRSNGGFGCDKCVGPLNEDLSVHVYEAHWCCTMRGGEGLARAAEYTYFVSGDKIIVPFLRNSSLEIAEKKLELRQETNYPFDNQVKFTFNKAPEQEISFSVFIPSYMKVNKVTINEEAVKPVILDDFLIIESKFKKGDEINLEYTQDIHCSSPHSKDMRIPGLQKVAFGPLVLGYKGDQSLKIHSCMKIHQLSENEFLEKDTGIKLVPLYHLLDPNVSDQSNYKMKVLFSGEIPKKRDL